MLIFRLHLNSLAPHIPAASQSISRRQHPRCAYFSAILAKKQGIVRNCHLAIQDPGTRVQFTQQCKIYIVLTLQVA